MIIPLKNKNKNKTGCFDGKKIKLNYVSMGIKVKLNKNSTNNEINIRS